MNTECGETKKSMNKYVFISLYGYSFPIAEKLKKKGNEVALIQLEDAGPNEDPVEKKRRLMAYDGILEKLTVGQFLSRAKNPDEWFVFSEHNEVWKVSEQLLKAGFTKGLFAKEEDHQFEKDRDMAQQFMKKHYSGLAFKEKKEFKSAKDGIAFLKTSPKMWAIKGNDPSAATSVPKQGDNEKTANERLMNKLQNDRKDYEKGGYILQEFIKDPVEFVPEMVFWNGKPIFSTIDIETKYRDAGDRGRQVGCGTNLVIQTPLDLPINKIAFPPVVHEMAKQRPGLFVWDLGILEKDGKYYPTEFCPNRFGYDSLFAEIAMCDGAEEFFRPIMEGKNPFEYKFGTSVRLFNEHMEKDGRLVQGDVLKGDDYLTFLWDAYREEKKSTGIDIFMKKNPSITIGYQDDLGAVACYSKDSPEDSAKNMYDMVAKIDDEYGYRDLNDFLATYYPTAIMTRYNALKEKKILPEIKSGKGVSYDYDGVVSKGVRPQKESTIITGNTPDKIGKITRKLAATGAPDVPIHPYPKNDLGDDKKDRDTKIGIFKAKKIKELGVEHHYEDTPLQASIIRKKTKANVIEVMNK